MKELVTSLMLIVVFGLCNSMVLVDEDKRQGLIPFPRVGRTSFLQAPYLHQEPDDFDGPYGPDDVLTVRYSRGLFSPRLGRRKRSPETATNTKFQPEESTYYDNDDNAVNVDDILRSRSPWAIVTYRDGIDKKQAFNPRLGRAMSPRLGRKRSEDKRPSSFSPRLGRGGSSSYNDGENDVVDRGNPTFQVENRAFNPRLGRSGSSGDNNQPTYTPMRGGRAFSPRLGRSDTNSVSDTRSTDRQNL